MTIIRQEHYSVIGLWLFFILSFLIPLVFFPNAPQQIIAGEDSVGTWMSGVLLIISATVCSLIATNRKWCPWLLFTLFFIALAIDERFMLHEAIKRTLVFTSYDHSGKSNNIVGEIPVIAGACIGVIVAIMLWRSVHASVRWFIIAGAMLGTASVVIDVMAVGVLWEDSLKLLAELMVTSALMVSTQPRSTCYRAKAQRDRKGREC
jgi:hypothetical protein